VPDELNKWATSKKDAKANKEIKPPDNYRNYDEDVYEPWTPGASQSGIRNNSVTSAQSSEEEDLDRYEGEKPIFAKDGSNVSLSDFQIKKVIGRGSFGKVFLVQKKTDQQVYAMKSLRKDVILDYDQVESTKLEKDILLKADHPFLVGMSYVFMTE
jgi:serine/threonine protein kinase